MTKAAGRVNWPEEVTTAELADWTGVSIRRVRDLDRMGIVVRGSKPGLYRFLPSFHGYLDYKRREAADVLTPGPLRMERVKTEKVTREIQELRFAELKGNILTVDEVTEAWKDFAGQIKTALLSIPKIAMDLMPSLTARDQVAIRTMVLDMLDSLVEEAEATVIAADPDLLKPTSVERAGIPRRRNRT